MKNGAFPTLPLIRHKADAVTLGGEFLELMVQRADRTALAERSSELMLPDSILLSATGVHVSVTVDFTPSMLVHMANTMLTGDERALIHVPVVVAGAS